jgi:hypothetical protein
MGKPSQFISKNKPRERSTRSIAANFCRRNSLGWDLKSLIRIMMSNPSSAHDISCKTRASAPDRSAATGPKRSEFPRLRRSSFPKEILKNSCALLLQNAGRDFALVVKEGICTRLIMVPLPARGIRQATVGRTSCDWWHDCD